MRISLLYKVIKEFLGELFIVNVAEETKTKISYDKELHLAGESRYLEFNGKMNNIANSLEKIVEKLLQMIDSRKPNLSEIMRVILPISLSNRKLKFKLRCCKKFCKIDFDILREILSNYRSQFNFQNSI